MQQLMVILSIPVMHSTSPTESLIRRSDRIKSHVRQPVYESGTSAESIESDEGDGEDEDEDDDLDGFVENDLVEYDAGESHQGRARLVKFPVNYHLETDLAQETLPGSSLKR